MEQPTSDEVLMGLINEAIARTRCEVCTSRDNEELSPLGRYFLVAVRGDRKHLLATDVSLADLAQELGISDPFVSGGTA